VADHGPGLGADGEGRAATIIGEVQAAVRRWPEFAAEARLADEWRDKIQRTHRLSFPEK
jgi:serine/threonine-protein kinase HipA